MSELNGLVSIIGDEDTVTGFLLAGIGQRFNNTNKTNFLVVNDRTTTNDIIDKFKELSNRDDISIILLTQTIAQQIRHILNTYDKTIPVVLEIPSKEQPYDENSDPIMQRVLKLLGTNESR